MDKISTVEVGQTMKLASENLRALSEENMQLREKVAHYEKVERVEKIASAMEEKGLEPELSFQDKVAGLMRRDRLDVVEEAVGLAAPQMKLASIHDPESADVGEAGSDNENGYAAASFAAGLASI